MVTYILDQQQSKLNWNQESGNEKTQGSAMIKGGKFLVKNGEIVDGFIKVDLDSLNLSHDLKMSEDDRKNLEQQLKSNDLLDTSRFPEVEFKIDEVTSSTGGSHFKGKLAAKNKEYGFSFPGYVVVDDQEISAKASFYLGASNGELKQDLMESVDDHSDDVKINMDLSITAHAEKL